APAAYVSSVTLGARLMIRTPDGVDPRSAPNATAATTHSISNAQDRRITQIAREPTATWRGDAASRTRDPDRSCDRVRHRCAPRFARTTTTDTRHIARR